MLAVLQSNVIFSLLCKLSKRLENELATLWEIYIQIAGLHVHIYKATSTHPSTLSLHAAYCSRFTRQFLKVILRIWDAEKNALFPSLTLTSLLSLSPSPFRIVPREELKIQGLNLTSRSLSLCLLVATFAFRTHIEKGSAYTTVIFEHCVQLHVFSWPGIWATSFLRRITLTVSCQNMFWGQHHQFITFYNWYSQFCT